MKYTLLFLSFMLAIGIACKRKPESHLSEKEMIDSVYTAFRILSDSVSGSWEKMVGDDTEKHRYMKRLLLEVSYTNLYDKEQFENLNGMIDRLSAMRYDQHSMKDSELIDKYDSATFSVTSHVIQYALDHPRYDDFPLMEELIDDINSKNDMILIHRIHYDGFTMRYNDFIEKNKDWLLKSGKRVAMEPLPLFQLPG